MGFITWRELGNFTPETLFMNNMLLKFYVTLQALFNREDGQDMAEYSLLLALITLAVISVVSGLTTPIKTIFTNVTNALSSAA